jgi:hypothetical protein
LDETDAEWQEAVDAAEFMLLLDSSRQYGLVTGGPKVNIERCEEILREGKQRGFEPAEDVVERAFVQGV